MHDGHPIVHMPLVGRRAPCSPWSRQAKYGCAALGGKIARPPRSRGSSLAAAAGPWAVLCSEPRKYCRRLDPWISIGYKAGDSGAKLSRHSQEGNMKFELAKTIAAAAVAGLSSIACGGSTPEPATPEAPSEAAAATEEAAGAAPAADAAHGAEAAATGADKACCKAMNECKGKGGCKVEGKNSCKGQNECKGQGGCNGHCPQ
jgi:hypothetical protein